MKSKKIYIICPVRIATDEDRKKLYSYAEYLEGQGYNVHLPNRDTNQDVSEYEACNQNRKALKDSDEVHIFYNPDSTGTHFDLGMAFALDKKIKVIEAEITKQNSFGFMIREWMYA